MVVELENEYIFYNKNNYFSSSDSLCKWNCKKVHICWRINCGYAYYHFAFDVLALFWKERRSVNFKLFICGYTRSFYYFFIFYSLHNFAQKRLQFLFECFYQPFNFGNRYLYSTKIYRLTIWFNAHLFFLICRN